MAKYYESTIFDPILYQMGKNSLSKSDLCTILGVCLPTLQKWIRQPGLIPLDKINCLAGSFGMYPEELVCILNRNKPQLNKDLVWYMEKVKKRMNEGDNM